MTEAHDSGQCARPGVCPQCSQAEAAAGFRGAAGAPEPLVADEQIRAYLNRNPDVFRAFLHRESRRDPRWLVDFVRHQERTGRPIRTREILGE